MKQLLLVLCIFIYSLSYSQTPSVSYGKIVHYENFSSTFISTRNVDVWLPPDYSTQKKYAVIYMHDGQMLFDSTITWNHQEWQADENMRKISSNKNLKPAIIVGIWNIPQTRYADYFPQKTIQFITDSSRKTIEERQLKSVPQADNYLKFIVNELKPFIDSTYSTHKDVNNTFLMGSSMGGLISLYGLCEYPNIFGAAACVSIHSPMAMNELINPTTDENVSFTFRNYLLQHLPKANSRRIYMDYGDQTLDAKYAPYQKKLDAILRKKGYKAPRWITRYFPGTDHSERSWADRMYIPLQFLLRK